MATLSSWTCSNFTGLAESPFTSLCLFNVSLTIHATLSSWTCSNFIGFSESVSPEPCPELESSSVCYSPLNSYESDAMQFPCENLYWIRINNRRLELGLNHEFGSKCFVFKQKNI
ncbi:hypothetical protein SADUNF_Sadunf08G0163700 [Salix dunnii]|uniref:Uncharacterized protein n=1 Tax=Salix dunnii TaxID=1413687 RepID=A0A835JZ32_9ROSI|nr:hypothetical protein SADUNF_Sadunf08G0163700 [Salix dunnii]